MISKYDNKIIKIAARKEVGRGGVSITPSYMHSGISFLLFLLLFSRVLLDKESPPSSFPSPRGTIVIPARGKNRYSGKRLLAAHASAIRGALMHRVWTGRAFLSSPIDRATGVDTPHFFFARTKRVHYARRNNARRVALTCGRTSEDSWLEAWESSFCGDKCCDRQPIVLGAINTDEYRRRRLFRTHVRVQWHENVIRNIVENYRWLSKINT